MPEGAEHTLWPEEPEAAWLKPVSAVVPFLGAGISAEGMPNASRLAEQIAAQFETRSGDYSDTSQLFVTVDEANVSEAELNEWVAATIAAVPIEPTALSNLLVRLPSNFIVTLNYDLHIERTAEAILDDPPVTLCGTAGLAKAYDLLSNRGRFPPDQLHVLHLHGCVTDPSSLVLSGDSYQRLQRDLRGLPFSSHLMRSTTLCFMGTALDEPDLLTELLAEAGDGWHFEFCFDSEVAALTGGRAALGSRYRLKLCPFGQASELEGFVARLLSQAHPSIPAEPAAYEVRHPLLDDYVPARLRDRPQAGEEADDPYFHFGVGDERRAPAPDETDLALGRRNLVVGAPGSGKTELLLSIAQKTVPGESAIFVRCSNLDLGAGSKQVLLERLASSGESIEGDLSVSTEALSNERFHFFLDGLDEIPPDRQARLADTVISLAEVFPRHRFTISSRPIEAVERFPQRETDTETGWRVLELTPDRSWQHAYLEQAGVSLDQLREEMPALDDLGELLYLPFFLSRTVQLHNDGALAGLPSLYTLLQTLLDTALAREESIPLEPQAARVWLRQVALVMKLSGRVSFTLADFEQVPLPDGQDILGPHSQVIEALVVRLLLQERPGGYAFSHRILGEALAAEALVDIEPTETLLNTIAPQYSEAVGGVRNDWLVPLAFLLPLQETWRQAVGDRDELVAARGVPPEASLEERLAAARTLWDTYAQWKIWMWDRDVGDLVQDHRALARLLTGEGMGDLLAEIRAAIDDENPQVQGNAIKVLASADADDLVADLKRVLTDTEREAVIRRQAAIAARDLGAVELLPEVLHCATHPYDDSEAQDCSLCAMDLAPEDKVVTTALALAANRQGYSLAISRLKRVGTAGDILRFLRVRAEAEPDFDSSLPSDREMLEEAADALVRGGYAEAEVSDVAYLAAFWETEFDSLEALIDRAPEPVLAGFMGAAEHDRGLTMLLGYAGRFTEQQLRDANAPDYVLRYHHHAQDPLPAPAEPPPDAPRTADEVGVSDLERALDDGGEQADIWILNNQQMLSQQAAALAPELAEALRGKLDGWWPEKPYADTITFRNPNSWSHEPEAATWINLAPALEMPLTTSRWAQLSTCGVLFGEQSEWLRALYTPEGAEQAAELLGEAAADVRVQVLRCIPDREPLPETLVGALTAPLAEIGQTGEVRYLGQRLAELHGPERVRAMCEATPGLEDELLTTLATYGDRPAQDRLLEQLRADVSQGQHPEMDDLHWMAGLRDPDHVPLLFECLEAMYPERDSGSGPRTSWRLSGLNQVISSIQNIGGAQAVDSYDHLLATSDAYAFLRLQRQTLAQGLLDEIGEPAAGEAAGSLALPDLSVQHG